MDQIADDKMKDRNGFSGKEKQIQDSILYMLPLIVSTLLPILTLPIFTRILSKEDYGVLALAQVYAVFVSSLANFGTTVSYDRNYFQYRGNREALAQLLFSTLSFVVLNSLLLAVLTYLFRASLSQLIIDSPKHGDILFYAFCSNCVILLNQFYYTYFRNSENAVTFISYTITGSLISLALSLYFIVSLRMGVIGLIYSQLISYGLVFCILTYKFLAKLPLSFNRRILFESLKISYPLTPRIFFGVIDNQFDKYMISLLGTLGGVGVYRIGQQVASMVFSFMTQLENVFIPGVYKRLFDLREKGGKEIGQYLTPFAYVSIFGAMLISLFSEEIISLLTHPSFHGAIDIVTVLCIYCGFLFFGKIIGTQLIFLKKTYMTSLMTMIGLGLNIFLNVLLIRKWGAIGAAWALLLSGVISRAIFFMLAQRYCGIKWEYKRIGAIYLLLIGSTLVTALLRNMDLSYSIRLVVKLVSLYLYVYLGVRINILTPENFSLVKNMFRGFSLWKMEKRPI